MFKNDVDGSNFGFNNVRTKKPAPKKGMHNKIHTAHSLRDTGEIQVGSSENGTGT
ncbi:unnamed protein product [Lupinus luteus]|uniref:Uncharacterized protein n=1 Tax=Lupinus luteus TaxID=3873 RepID=A0AAV1VXZ7_LUPLU